MIEKTDITVDIQALRDDYLQNYQSWPICENRICLNNYSDNDDYSKNASIRLIYTEYTHINSLFKNTIWEETLNLLPGKIGRARIMLMGPNCCLEQHRDLEVRWQLALFTDPACIAVDVNANTEYHIPSDGYFYRLDARKLHAVYNNTNHLMRVHLVVAEYV
jgi:hypothetical protein